MKAAGMVALTVNAADMKALVAYVTSLGGGSVASAATPLASGASSSAASKTEPAATAEQSKNRLRNDANPFRGIRACASESGASNDGRTVENVNWWFPRRCNRNSGEEYFRFSGLRWMPRRKRRRRRRASADSRIQSVSASSIDGTSEGAH